MRLPRSVVIGPHRWALVLDHNQLLAEAGDCHGVTVTRRRTIAVDAELEGTARLEILLHELLHACLANHTFPGDDGDEQEEAVVNALAGPLLDLLRRNPGIVRVLTGVT